MAEKRNLIRFILGFGLLIVAVAIRDYFPSGLGAGTWGLALYAGLLVIARPRESSPPAAGRESATATRAWRPVAANHGGSSQHWPG
jgi:hypothetical protein